MMAEEVGALTFPMSRESESASRLKTIISDMLPRFSDDYVDDVFSEYVIVLVCNGKSQSQAREDLDPFLGEKSRGFVACLWELLLKYFSLDKQENMAYEPRTGVDFGSHDTLMEQDLSSRKYDDCDQKATDATNSMNVRLRHMFGIQAKENKVVQQHVPPFLAVYSEQYNETYQREILAVGYRHGVF